MTDKNASWAYDPATLPNPSPPTGLARILVVDDDGDIRQLNSDLLIGSGYEVDAAEDGLDAWNIIQLHDYDLLITDNEMPRVSGVELLRKLRAAQMALPVIMATGVLPQDEFSRHPWLRPAATLSKPYSIEQFLATVEQVLRVNDSAPGQAGIPINWQTDPSTDGWEPG